MQFKYTTADVFFVSRTLRIGEDVSSLINLRRINSQRVWSCISCNTDPPQTPLAKGALFKGGLGGSGDWEGPWNDRRAQDHTHSQLLQSLRQLFYP